MSKRINVNCGVLGHIDSGKTSLCRAMHHVASTASMDKHPQSRERGITLDLGFSSFSLKGEGVGPRSDELEFTLVDCPGHASLIKTVLGASQIVDLCLLIIDVQKGFQPQTAECLIIAEIVTPILIIVFNKIDLIEQSSRQDYLRNLEERIRKTMAKTRFGRDVPITYISAAKHTGVDVLVQTMRNVIQVPPHRRFDGALHVSFDHCFSVKGQGTIFTGTVLAGQIFRGDKVILPEWGETGEIRSIQAFRRPTDSAHQGDRVGLCIPGISPSDKERGDIYSKDCEALYRGTSIVCIVRKVRFYKGQLNDVQLQINFGHQHAMAKLYFLESRNPCATADAFDATVAPIEDSSALGKGPLLSDIDRDFPDAEILLNRLDSTFTLVEDIDACQVDSRSYLCLMLLDRKVIFPPNATLIGSRLDVDPESAGCRIALYGRHVACDLSRLKESVRKRKQKVGVIARKQDENTYLVKGLLKKEGGDPSRILGSEAVHIPSNSKGIIESTFGKSGLLKIRFKDAVSAELDDEVRMDVEKPSLVKIMNSHEKSINR